MVHRSPFTVHRLTFTVRRSPAPRAHQPVAQVDTSICLSRHTLSQSGCCLPGKLRRQIGSDEMRHSPRRFLLLSPRLSRGGSFAILSMTRVRSGVNWASRKKRDSSFWKVTTQTSLDLESAGQRPSLAEVTHPNGNLSKDHPGTSVPLALCYLCFLLFKFSLLPSV